MSLSSSVSKPIRGRRVIERTRPSECFSKMGSRVTTVVALGGLISVVTFITIDRFDSEEDDQERS